MSAPNRANDPSRRLDLSKFSSLVRPADDGGEGYLDNILNHDHEKEEWSNRYLTMDAPHPWPKNYLKEVSEPEGPSEEYRNNLRLALTQSGAGETVTVRRTGKPRQGTINNVSLHPNWAGGGSIRPRATYEWEVPLNDVVGVGKAHEGEVFVNHPKGRQVTKVATPIKGKKKKK